MFVHKQAGIDGKGLLQRNCKYLADAVGQTELTEVSVDEVETALSQTALRMCVQGLSHFGWFNLTDALSEGHRCV